MSADFVQGNQSAVLHIGDECTVGEGAFVDVRIFGVGLKEGLPGGFVDYLHGDTLYGCGGETLCPSQVGYTCEKRGTEPARTEALASPPANKLSPRYAQASTVCLAGLKLPDFGARTKANAFNILNLLQR